MTKKSVAAAAFALACVSPALIAGQTKKPATSTYKVSRTAWGDPDFSGNYTNLYESGTPLERPQQFDGKKLSDVTPEELRAFKKNIQDTTRYTALAPDRSKGFWSD